VKLDDCIGFGVVFAFGLWWVLFPESVIRFYSWFHRRRPPIPGTRGVRLAGAIWLVLLIVVTIASLPRFEQRRLADQAEKIAEIKAGSENVSQLNMHDADFAEQIAREPACAAKIEGVAIWTDDLPDVRWTRLRDFPNLRSISVYDSPHADKFLERLAGMPRLESLSLCKTDVSEAGLRHIAALPNLTRLHSFLYAYSHPSLEPLRGHPRLESLWIEGRDDQDLVKEWLAVLKTLPRLRELDLKGSAVGPETRQLLHKALPRCTITPT
jgi:hypothetical protein